MKSFCFALASLGLLACVPASEPRHPAGAAGFLTVPSAAARGEPFTTADGWTVTIEKILVQATVSAAPAEHRPDAAYIGSFDVWLFDASRSALVYARELEPGAWKIGVRLDGSYVSTGSDTHFDEVVNIGVSPADEARFRRFVDVGYGPYMQPGATYGPGPSVVLVLHAKKDERTIALDLSFGGLVSSSDDENVLRHVRANDVDVGPLEIRPERIFASESSGELRFGPIAAADRNGDGRVTAAELIAAPKAELSKEQSTQNLGDTLVVRCKNIFVLP